MLMLDLIFIVGLFIGWKLRGWKDHWQWEWPWKRKKGDPDGD